jgi:hypothetical protein
VTVLVAESQRAAAQTTLLQRRQAPRPSHLPSVRQPAWGVAGQPAWPAGGSPPLGTLVHTPVAIGRLHASQLPAQAD